MPEPALYFPLEDVFAGGAEFRFCVGVKPSGQRVVVLTMKESVSRKEDVHAFFQSTADIQRLMNALKAACALQDLKSSELTEATMLEEPVGL